MRIVLLREKYILIKMHLQAERLYFLFSFSIDIILGDRCDKKHQKQLFYLSKTSSFSEFGKNVTF